ncbi:serine protease inhibitor 77Ba-like isoform X3 [Zeugodacus cucurbitae]|nr:serine protease inhibitor 77Ba-like isoform X3 [Zeugodacus cucurbitae]
MLLRKAYIALLSFSLCILMHLTASEHCSKLENASTVLQTNRAQFLSIADGAEKFGLELFTEISSLAGDNDFVFSPFSVWALLLLLVEVASQNTLHELNTALHLNVEPKVLRQAFNVVQQFLLRKTPTIQVESLQAMYYDTYEKVNDDYKTTLTTCYNARVQSLNFNDTQTSLNFINNAINTETKGLIKDAFDEYVVEGTKLLLTSTLYFKGQWQSPFNKSETRTETFYDMNGKPVGEVEMMFQMTPFNYTRMVELQAHVLELPYGNENRLCMLAILPNKGISVNQVVQNLQKIGVRPIFNKLEEDDLAFGEQEVGVFLPRFETTVTLPLRGSLEKLGIKSIFDPKTVNLDALSNSLYVKDVMQSTKIIVNEEGTEAAAVTAAILANKISPPKFYFNRPFLYLIAEKGSNMLLFAGQISSPTLPQKN